MMSQSNCFRVIDPAFARAKGGAAGAHWIVTPNIIMSNSDAGGFNMSGLMSAVPGGSFISSAAGSIRTKEAQTALFLSNAKTGVQVAAVQGKAQATDFDASFIGGGRGANNFGGYTNTPEGKVVMAAFADAFNKLVERLRTQKSA
jgi:curli biogenesis system outer membrane secretion channel CsgG